MNTLDTTHESSNSWSPYKVETKQFLEDAKRETFANMVKATVGNSYDDTKVYVLYGCDLSISGSSYTITAGAIFCRDAYAQANNLPGEVFTVPGVTLTVNGGNVVVANLLDTADPIADPTIFSDNASHDIHRVRQAVFVAGASGSGTLTGNSNCDFGNFIFMCGNNYQQLTWRGTSALNSTTLTYNGSANSCIVLETLTTPDDGAFRNWEIEFKAILKLNNGGGHVDGNAFIMIVNGTSPLALPEDTGSLDYANITSAGGTSTPFAALGTACTCVCKVPRISLAPNTAITFQFFNGQSSTDCELTAGVIVLKEVK